MPSERRRPGKAASNEQPKAVATLLNAASVAFVVAAVIQPMVTLHLRLASAAVAVGRAIALQSALHYLLSKVED